MTIGHMAIYVGKTTVGFQTEYGPPHCDRQYVRCKYRKALVRFQREYHYEMVGISCSTNTMP